MVQAVWGKWRREKGGGRGELVVVLCCFQRKEGERRGLESFWWLSGGRLILEVETDARKNFWW